jgi:hypothetical protein
MLMGTSLAPTRRSRRSGNRQADNHSGVIWLLRLVAGDLAKFRSAGLWAGVSPSADVPAAGFSPFIVLLGQDWTDQADDRLPGGLDEESSAEIGMIAVSR